MWLGDVGFTVPSSRTMDEGAQDYCAGDGDEQEGARRRAEYSSTLTSTGFSQLRNSST